MYEKQIHVHAPKHVRKEYFFSPEHSPTHEHQSLENDEPVVDPKFNPDAIPKPLEYEHGQPMKHKMKLKYQKQEGEG